MWLDTKSPLSNVLYIIPSNCSSLDAEKKSIKLKFQKSYVSCCLSAEKCHLLFDRFHRSHTISLFLLASPGYEGLWTRYTKKAMILPLTMGTSLPRTQSPFSLSMKKLRAKEVGKEKLLIFLLPMDPCASSPVTRVSHSPLCVKRRAWGGDWDTSIVSIVTVWKTKLWKRKSQGKKVWLDGFISSVAAWCLAAGRMYIACWRSLDTVTKYLQLIYIFSVWMVRNVFLVSVLGIIYLSGRTEARE